MDPEVDLVIAFRREARIGNLVFKDDPVFRRKNKRRLDVVCRRVFKIFVLNG